MNIIEATKEAMQAGKGITNTEWRSHDFYLLPTNTQECYLIIPINFSVDHGRACPRWNPHAADILSEAWTIFDTGISDSDEMRK
ncbi:MAG: MW1434 family type I TA system toxin [Candidatus Ornithomonoglobus sp.]